DTTAFFARGFANFPYSDCEGPDLPVRGLNAAYKGLSKPPALKLGFPPPKYMPADDFSFDKMSHICFASIYPAHTGRTPSAMADRMQGTLDLSLSTDCSQLLSAASLSTADAAASGGSVGKPGERSLDVAQSHEEEPGAEVLRPGAEVLQPGAEVLRPGAEVLRPGAEVLRPGAEVLRPAAEVLQQSGIPAVSRPAEAKPAEFRHPRPANIDAQGDVVPAASDVDPAASDSALAEQASGPVRAHPDGGPIGRCDERCYRVGTCFEELGRCDCPAGWEGPYCNVAAEKYQTGELVAWNKARREGRSSEGGSELRGDFDGGPGRRGVLAKSQKREGERKDKQFPCNLDCGGEFRGSCFIRKTQAKCICTMGFKGDNCELDDWTMCMGGCGGRGKCKRGFCHCDPGFFGIDCSLRLRDDGSNVSEHVPYTYLDPSTQPSAPLPEDVRIYVYELPPAFNVWMYTDMDAIRSEQFMDGKYGTGIHPSVIPGGYYVGPCELFLHERLLSSARRTTDPQEADYFFVPAWGQVAKFGGNYRYRGGQWGYWQAVRDYIDNTYPFWSRKGGADHIWVMMGDHGACEQPRGHGIPTAVLPSILLSNWGLTTDTAATGLRAYLDKGPCFRAGQDIVIPAPLNSNHMSSPFRRASSAPAAKPSRLKERLLAYSDEDIAAMQAELKCAWPWMIWSSVYGTFGDEDGSRDAFEALLGTLQMRRDGIPPRKESMCNYEPPRIARSQRACHMYCDTAPSAPADVQCRQQ
ncbi:hypothetical protein CYMTET_35982, partial [Cymbomonas tetramitiformis]